MRRTIFLSIACAPFLSFACCGVTPGQPIEFGKQENIVIYNSKTKIEFFVRNAKFKTASKDFGFIAPTPSEPEIFGVSDELFRKIDDYFPSMGRGMKESLSIVKIENVGGYQATVLKATDSRVLTEWLKVNQYSITPGIKQWLDHYVKKNWYLTAFKIINQAEVTESGIIAMKFRTDLPFHPYYVPKENSPTTLDGGLDCKLVSDFESADSFIGPHPNAFPKVDLKSIAIPIDEPDMVKIASLLKTSRSELPVEAYAQRWEKVPFPITAKDDIFFRPTKPLFAFASLVN